MRDDGKEFLIDGTDWAIPSKGLDGFGEYENDIETVDNAVGDGGIITSTRIAPKDRTIQAISRNPKHNEALRKHTVAFFNGKFNYKVYLTYMGVTRWTEGRIYKFALPNRNIYKRLELKVTFLCPNPFLKSYEDFGKDIASVSGMIAFPFLCARTKSYHVPKGTTGGIYNFASKVILANDGDVETYCKAIIRANGTVINPKLIINEKYVRIIDTMNQGDQIEIDFVANPPTVKKNGQNIVGKCDRTSAFDEMALLIGDNEVAYDADDGGNVLECSIYYNKLYSAM